MLLLFNAGPLNISWAKDNVDAIIECFLPAQVTAICSIYLVHVWSRFIKFRKPVQLCLTFFLDTSILQDVFRPRGQCL